MTRVFGRGLHFVRMWTCPEQLLSVHCEGAAVESEETPGLFNFVFALVTLQAAISR